MSFENPKPSKLELSRKEIEDKQSSRDFNRAARAQYQRNNMPKLRYVTDALTGKLPTPESISAEDRESFESELQQAKDGARKAMSFSSHDKFREHPEDRSGQERWEFREPIGDFFERALQNDDMPTVVISEDVSGRFMASVMKTFLGKVADLQHPGHANIPVISYAVGRSTSPEAAKKSARRVSDTLEEKYTDQTVLVCSDQISTGASIIPLIAALQFRAKLKIMLDRGVLPSRELDKYSLAPHTFIDAAPTEIIRPGEVTFHRWDMGRHENLRPVRRTGGPNSWNGDELVSAELPEDRPDRLRAIQEVADTLYEAFLDRPGVGEYLRSSESAKDMQPLITK